MRPPRLFALAAAVAGTATLTALTAPHAVAEGGPKGSAFAVSIQASAVNAAKVSIGPAPLATHPAGADKSIAKVDLAKLGVHAKVINATSGLQGGKLVSTASIADVDVMGLLKAKVIESTCTSDGTTVTGRSTLAEVTLLGHKVDVSVRGKVDVAGLATVAVDEQVTAPDGTLTVNALRVSFGGKLAHLAQGEIILSQATCAKSAGGTTPGGPATTTPAPGTSTTATTPNTSPSPTSTASQSPVTTSPGSGAGTGAGSGTGTGTGTGITPVANEGDLASTGVSAVLPLTLGGLALLGGGAGAYFYARRKRTA